jgi:FkbM family methyltransferase
MKKTILKNDFTGEAFQLFGLEADRSVFQPIEASGGRWETHIVRILSCLVRPRDICLDIGANIGAFSLYMSGLAHLGRIHAFEPSQKLYNCLAKNVQMNGLSNIICYNLGLSDTEGVRPFYTFNEIPGASFGGHQDMADPRDAVRKVLNYDFDFETTLVPITTLDNWAVMHQVSNIDLIKIDVEGGERFVLLGAHDVLKRCRPIVITEFNAKAMKSYFGMNPSEYYDLLRSLYHYIYLIQEDGIYPVRNYDCITDVLTDQHFWSDILCTLHDLGSIPEVADLVRPSSRNTA